MTAGATSRSAGFALIVVLWFLVLISAIAVYLMIDARSETAIARNMRAAAEAEALADAGVAQAVFNQTEPAAAYRWLLDGKPHIVQLPTGRMTIRLSDERLKINPNHASIALLAGLFQSVGVDYGASQRLAAAVADWVGPGDKPRPLGAKKDEYASAGRSYGPPNAPLESLDELQLVLGMTPEIHARVRPYLTIFTAGGDPDPKKASPVVRNALLLAARARKPPQAVEAATKSPEAQGTPENAVASQNGASDAANQQSGEQQPPQDVIELEVVAEGKAGGSFARHAVLGLDSNNVKGYKILDWRRAELAMAQELPGR